MLLALAVMSTLGTKRKAGFPCGSSEAKISRTAFSGLARARFGNCRQSIAPSSSNHENRIKVFVRVRPFNEQELTQNEKKVVEVLDEQTLIFDQDEPEEEFFFHGKAQKRRDINKRIKKNMDFDFDRVFGPQDSTEDIYAVTSNIVSSIFEGYNCSVFAYGATGAGKTFTMLGNKDCPGIMYRTIVQLLDHIQSINDTHTVVMGASYIEIYNEIIRDLLHSGNNKSGGLFVREEGGVVVISGLKVKPVVDSEELLDLLHEGNKLRTQHPTDRNAESSRSHAIFQIHIKMQEKKAVGDPKPLSQVKICKLSMIDLAGSERASATSHNKLRLKEGSNINKSLLALGNCINALSGGLTHVPYRDSKLTRILKDSLGGNCRTVMIANVSPSARSYEDTYNTLKYASRAKTITTKASKNLIDYNMSVQQCKKLIEDLQSENSFLQEQLKSKTLCSPELDMWMVDVEKVMLERKRLHVAHMTFQAQCKLTEWRLCRKTKALMVNGAHEIDPSSSVARLTSAVSQLRARRSMFKQQLQAIVPELNVNNKDREELLSRLANIADKKHYHIVFKSWEAEVANSVKSVTIDYFNKLARLMSNSVQSNILTNMIDFAKQCYDTLKCHNHVTNAMTCQMNSLMKSIAGVKEVTWDDYEMSNSEVENDDGNLDPDPIAVGYFYRLLPPLDSRALDDVDPEVEQCQEILSSELGAYFERKKLPRSGGTPLKTIQTPPHMNTFRKKGINNKENMCVPKKAKMMHSKISQNLYQPTSSVHFSLKKL